MRAQQRARVEVEGVARIARGVRLRLVERVEVVPDGLDLTAVVDLVAHAEEDVLDPAAQLRDQVQAARAERLAGQRRVERLPSSVADGCELGLAAGERRLDRRATAFSAIPVSRSRTSRSASFSSLLRPR